jgi:hypothetical protein
MIIYKKKLIKKKNHLKNLLPKTTYKIFIGIFISLALGLYSLALIYYGINFVINQNIFSLRDAVWNIYDTKLNVVNNYFKSITVSPEKMFIDINFKNFQKLNYARDMAIERGIISYEDQEIKVNAKINFENRIFKATINPTGQNLDMIGSNKKRAFKVKIKREKKLWGMKEFKLLPPQSRYNLEAIIANEIEKKENLISQKRKFIELFINGESWGIYLIEEGLRKELLESNSRKEGIIFGLAEYNPEKSVFERELKIRFHNYKSIQKNKILKDQHNLLQIKWKAWKNKELSVEKVFDLKQFAKFFALVDIFNGYHSIFDQNLKFYFNPITNLIEPIPREYNGLVYPLKFNAKSDVMIKRVSENTLQGYTPLVVERLFSDINFTNYYMNFLREFSKKDYFDYVSKKNKKVENSLTILYKSKPYYSFPYKLILERQNHINYLLNVKDPQVIAYYHENDASYLPIEIINNGIFPIRCFSIINDSGDSLKIDDSFLFSGDTLNIELNKNKRENIFGSKLIFNFIDNNNIETPLIPKNLLNNNILPGFILTSDVSKDHSNMIIIDSVKKEISFLDKYLEQSSDIIIPEGYKVFGSSGLRINQLNNSKIYSQSPFFFNGTSSQPIIVFSSDSSGQGIFISKSDSRSEFNQVIFKNLSNPKDFGWSLTGAITFYESDVDFNNCVFEANLSGDDYLNIVRSNFNIQNSKFININSDAFDSDFSNGEISYSSFINCGNDGIDISGSKVKIINVLMNNIGDKGLSAGESSQMLVENFKISNSAIGICSKDMSEISGNNFHCDNVQIGITTFQKKPEYGPGKFDGKIVKIFNAEIPYLIEKNSICRIDDLEMSHTNQKVEDILYGVEYGKSSL